MTDLIEIDGSYGEGGGSILRLACALAVLTKKSVRIYNIRKNRPTPGLKTQHLVGLQALAEISNGELENGEIGSTSISFKPGTVKGGVYHLKVGTAGSVGLILQILQLASLKADGKVSVEIDGGATFGLWAPTLPYLQKVTIPHLKQMGYFIEIELKRHGFYPKGGAKVRFDMHPKEKLSRLHLTDFGTITEIAGISIASFHLKKKNVAERQARAAEGVIHKIIGEKAVIESSYVDVLNPGSGICVWLKTDSGVILGSDVIGEKRKASEEIGTECARYLCRIMQDKATVDRFLSDQVIPFMALAEGTSIIKPNELTNHTKTNIWLIEQFLGKKFTVHSEGRLKEIRIDS
ncbi:MAG: RNA 3'-terminal phosphate cyclase [Promethearchaeota archaeon]|nr:MAG: RNA 3'-terminal phosphate cyclase [Candidatus Lokiarchaeota archaeon]